MLKWLTYSGLSIIITVNPCHWRLVPWVRKEIKEWAGPNEHTISFGILFLTITAWIDDGSW
ncbi:MAG: hypothetical protein EB127_15985 [Alphaproteobacteria bacterium]|nr:hypothetical protein [Alphaproteobacteria bacterium]